MIIDISSTEKSIGESFEISFLEAFEPFDYNGVHYVFAKSVTLKGTYFVKQDAIMIVAEISADLLTPCMRCLVDANVKVDVSMTETYSRNSAEGIYAIAGHKLSLDKAIVDNIVLNMPMHVVCKETCKGLCLHCGIDLNKKNCTCDIENKKANGPFGALNGLFSDNKEV